MVVTLHVLSLVLYLAAAALLAGSLAGGYGRVIRLGSAVGVAGVMIHGAALGSYVASFGELPLVGLAPSFSALGFIIGLFLLAAAALRDARTLGLILVPIVVILLVAALVLGIRPTGELVAFRGLWLYFHTALAFVGFAGFAVAFAAGVVYLLQFRELKGKRLGRVFRFFPSLGMLDRVGWWSLAIGFPALSLGILVGWAWIARFEGRIELREPKVVWGVLTWLIFAGAIMARAGGAGRTRRGAMASVVAFLVVVAVYVVLRLTEVGTGVFL